MTDVYIYLWLDIHIQLKNTVPFGERFLDPARRDAKAPARQMCSVLPEVYHSIPHEDSQCKGFGATVEGFPGFFKWVTC